MPATLAYALVGCSPVTRTVAPSLLRRLAGLTENPHAPGYLRLADRLRKIIGSGALAAGDRMPASRVLARELLLSRSTVEQALGLLEDEGLVERRQGSGTFVSRDASIRPLSKSSSHGRFGGWSGGPLAPAPSLARRLLSEKHNDRNMVLAPGQVELSLFPRSVWGKLLNRAVNRPGVELWSPVQVQGYGPLRAAIARHLAGSRGVECEPDDVVILASTQQALTLIAQVTLQPGDVVLVENPGYGAAAAAFQLAGAELRSVPLDEEGPRLMDVDLRGARLFYTTPSHQFPTGLTTSLRRRDANLALTSSSGVWTVEDDYDCELVMDQPPIISIQGLAAGAGVFHVGTFNNTMFPSLGIAYLVAPSDAREQILVRLSASTGAQSAMPQAAMADFILEGHYDAYLRKMRVVYAERRQTFVEASDALYPHLRFPVGGGMYVSGFGKWDFDDAEISRRALDLGIALRPLSSYYRDAVETGFVFGVTTGDRHEIASAVRRVGALLTSARRGAA